MSEKIKMLMVSAFHEQGGNVFQRHLDGHPELLVYPFESQISTPLSRNILAGPNHSIPQRYCYPEFSSEMNASEVYHSFWDQELKTFLRTPNLSKFKNCGLVMDEQERIDYFLDKLYDMSLSYIDVSRRQYILAFFESTFKTWKNLQRPQNPKYMVGYSPPIGLEADKFFSDFPDGHMVHVVRNPVFGYADTKKRPFPFNIETYCRLWNFIQVEASIYEEKYKGKFHIVYYNELCKRKEEVMRKICKAIGIEYDKSLLYPSFDGEELTNIKPWGTIEKCGLDYELMLKSLLRHEEYQTIVLYCGDNRFFGRTLE